MILALVRRHMRIFFRDRMTVFFALLSPLILFVLYTAFLGTQQVQNIQHALPKATGPHIHYFVNSWLFASIILITTLTSGLVNLGIFVNDRASGRFSDFLVGPLSRGQMIGGYLLAAFTTSLLMSSIIFIFSQVYIVLTGGEILSLQYAFEAYAVIILLCLTFAAISSFIVTFISSYGAFSAFNTILGTAVGFLAGAYIMADSIPKGVLNFMNLLPFNEGASLLRRPFTNNALKLLVGNQSPALIVMRRNFSIALVFDGHPLRPQLIICIFIVLIVVFSLLGSWRICKSIK
jgi:multidrug/hemolysin transport system permease protein